jgi:hypothetical protein
MKDEEFIRKELSTIDLRGVDEIVQVRGPQHNSSALRIICPKCRQPPGLPCFREAFKRTQALGFAGRAVMSAPHKERMVAWKKFCAERCNQ